MASISGIPASCRPHAQKIIDIANNKIRSMRQSHRETKEKIVGLTNKKIGELKQRHKEYRDEAERHISLYHNTMSDFMNASTPQDRGKKLNQMKTFYTGTVRGQTPKGKFASPSGVAGEFYDKFLKRTGRNIDIEIRKRAREEQEKKHLDKARRAKRRGII